jgi:hypothetical protein
MILRGITDQGAVREQQAAVEREVAEARAEAADAAEAAVKAKVCQPGLVNAGQAQRSHRRCVPVLRLG